MADVGPAETTETPPATSRPGQYWHVHECRWVRYAEPSTDEILVPEQGTAADVATGPAAVTG